MLRLMCLFKVHYSISCVENVIVLFLGALIIRSFIDHLHQYLLCVLKSFVHARVFAFKIAAKWKLLDLLL